MLLRNRLLYLLAIFMQIISNTELNILQTSRTVMNDRETAIGLTSVGRNKCVCSENEDVLDRAKEHFERILLISSEKLLPDLINVAHTINAEINAIVHKRKWKLYERIRKNFQQFMSQPSFAYSIEELTHKVLNQLFVSSDISPTHIEMEMEIAVQNFFVQIMPSIFVCLSSGPCRSVSQSYANCIQRNSISWKLFYGKDPSEMVKKLKKDILNYRIIEKSIDRLQRYAIEMKVVDGICIKKYTSLAYCSRTCLQEQLPTNVPRYCYDNCRDVIENCFGQDAKDWNSFISILSKLSVDFYSGLRVLDQGIINAISYALDYNAPSIANAVLIRCGPVNASKSSGNADKFIPKRPATIEKKAASMIRRLNVYMDWWSNLSAYFCNESSRSSACWDGKSVVKKLVDNILNV